VSAIVLVMRWQKRIPMTVTLRSLAGSIHGSSPNLRQYESAMVEIHQTI
jgi:hypothetical protein